MISTRCKKSIFNSLSYQTLLCPKDIIFLKKIKTKRLLHFSSIQTGIYVLSSCEIQTFKWCRTFFRLLFFLLLWRWVHPFFSYPKCELTRHPAAVRLHPALNGTRAKTECGLFFGGCPLTWVTRRPGRSVVMRVCQRSTRGYASWWIWPDNPSLLFSLLFW